MFKCAFIFNYANDVVSIPQLFQVSTYVLSRPEFKDLHNDARNYIEKYKDTVRPKNSSEIHIEIYNKLKKNFSHYSIIFSRENSLWGYFVDIAILDNNKKAIMVIEIDGAHHYSDSNSESLRYDDNQLRAKDVRRDDLFKQIAPDLVIIRE